MKQKVIIIIIIVVSGISRVFAQDIKLPAIFSDAEKQTELMIEEILKAKSSNADRVSPRTLDSAGNLKLVASRDWTSGFFPGVLWFLFEFTGNKEWKQQAEHFTANIEREKTNGGTHDMGFKIYCSFGTGFRLTKNQRYKDVIIQSARTLSTRFRPITGTMRSWDHSTDKWAYPVIIDNMMNLELLFAATQLTGDSSFYKIAVAHANTTMKNHYRADNSSYHVVEYDTLTGKVVKKNTHQGYSHESAWARGQVWGLYGYTMCYRFTKDKKYLEQAEKIAAFVLDHPNMPKDLIPYWDFNANGIPNTYRDASAAAIMGSALIELSGYVPRKLAQEYKKMAATIIVTLSDSTYRTKLNEKYNFLLKHSVGHLPANSEVDTPLSYADYYYLEAMLRWRKMKK